MLWPTVEGKERHGLRKQTMEPVFGIIEEAVGFRRFQLKRNSRRTSSAPQHSSDRPYRITRLKFDRLLAPRGRHGERLYRTSLARRPTIL